MKKIIAVVIAVFVLIGVSISVMLIGASRVSLFYRDSDDHMREVLVNGSRVYAHRTDIDAPATSLHVSNTSAFMQAVSRSGLTSRMLPPSGDKGVVVTFPDGAEYTVVDGGTDSSGEDTAYIIYKYKGRTYYYSLSGYLTFDRVTRCISPEGFGVENWIVEDASSGED